MKSKILILLGFLALASCSTAKHYNSDKIQKQNSVDNVNKRNKKNLKKWGLGHAGFDLNVIASTAKQSDLDCFVPRSDAKKGGQDGEA